MTPNITRPQYQCAICVLIDPDHPFPTERWDYAKQLSKKIGIPICDVNNTNYLAFLIVRNHHLELQMSDKKLGPIYANFTQGPFAYRLSKINRKNELIARAAGLKAKQPPPQVLDATAGLGYDAFILGALGCDVTLLEKNAIIAALLKDGIQRAKKEDGRQKQTLHFIEIDALLYLKQSKKKFDVIYLDPMFPVKKKGSKSKKTMEIFQTITQNNIDASLLLEIALQKAINRVVVKRPKLAPALNGPPPSITYKGNSIRFDTYLIGCL